MVTLMEHYEWFPAYMDALTEVDRIVAIDKALGILVNRYELLQRDCTEEREVILRAVAILRDLRKQSVEGKISEDADSDVSTLLRVAAERVRRASGE
jgi:hypothetical protein